MLTPYGKREWLTILLIGAALVVVALFAHLGWLAGAAVVVVLALLSFFRDPRRTVPTRRGVMVSPADGHVSSVHEVERFDPFDGPATCVRIFLSVLDVHVNRAPCHGKVASINHRDGLYLNALSPQSAEVNESNLIVLLHPTRQHPVAGVKQIAGKIARRIVCALHVGDVVQRGDRFGMIKFGSTTELYVPKTLQPRVLVTKGQRVYGGATELLEYTPLAAEDESPDAAVETAAP